MSAAKVALPIARRGKKRKASASAKSSAPVKLPVARRPHRVTLLRDGWRVEIPTGRNRDGKWAKRRRVEGVLRKKKHAEALAKALRAESGDDRRPAYVRKAR